MHSIDVAILDAETDHMCELFGLAWAAHGGVRIKPVLNLLRHLGAHWRREDARCDSCCSDTISTQVASHGENNAVDSALAGTIGNLTSLSLFSSDATDEKNDATFPINWRVLSHGNCCIFGHVD